MHRNARRTDRPAPPAAPAHGDPDADRTSADPVLEALLDFIREHRGFDFTGYKRPSLERRLKRRMRDVDVPTVEAYRDYLAERPDEFRRLFNTVLINVTEFFRDPEAWERLRGLLEARAGRGIGDKERIRIWSAGCATGEEAYTLAIVLAEVLGVQAFLRRVKIFATDVDPGAIEEARRGVYDRRALERVPESLVGRYFEPTGRRLRFRSDLRRRVIFGRNDLLTEAPIGEIDLLVCRNTLMYFNAEAQARILRHFHFSLAPGGLLFLGRAETMRTQGALFVPIDLRGRIFERTDPGRDEGVGDLGMERLRGGQLGATVRQLALMQAELDGDPDPHLVVGVGGRLILVSRAARERLGASVSDLGRPVTDLELFEEPDGLLRSIRRVASGASEAITFDGVALKAGADAGGAVDLTLGIVRDTSGALIGVDLVLRRPNSGAPS